MAGFYVPRLVVPATLGPPHPLLAGFRTNEPTGFCMHPTAYALMDDEDASAVAYRIPAPILATRMEIVRREIIVLEECLNRFQLELPPGPAGSTAALTRKCILNGYHRMARSHLRSADQLQLNAQQIAVLHRALAII